MQFQSHQWKRGAQVQAILDAAKAATPFRSLSGEPFAAIPNGPFSHTALPLRSREFRLWLAHNFDLEYGAPSSDSAVRGALSLLEARAIFSGPELPVGNRILGDDRKITLDLANSDGECVEITARGWQVTDTVACGFLRTKSSPLPVPVAENSAPADSTPFDTFRRLLNLASAINWDAALTWLTNALRPSGPCPIMVIEGPPLSGKSTLARLLKALIDPSATPLTSLPPRAEKITRLAAGRHVLAFDSVGSISPAKAAVLSGLANSVDRSHPVILVLASGNATPLPDNIERHSIRVTLEASTQLRTYYDLQREFEQSHPLILGALCTAVSSALQRFAETARQTYERLPDATAWTKAATAAAAIAEDSILPPTCADASPTHDLAVPTHPPGQATRNLTSTIRNHASPIPNLALPTHAPVSPTGNSAPPTNNPASPSSIWLSRPTPSNTDTPTRPAGQPH
jgi:hypothetical protein